MVDEKKYPLRIDRHTVIFVREENLNEEYALKVRLKFQKSFNSHASLEDLKC